MASRKVKITKRVVDAVKPGDLIWDNGYLWVCCALSKAEQNLRAQDENSWPPAVVHHWQAW